MFSIQKIGVIGRTYRHLNRYRQIIAVFVKYGLGDLIDRLNIDQYIEVGMQMISRKRREKVDKFTTAERIRTAFEELGPTFIKFGQILSTRPGLLPVDYIYELSKLQDNVPPYPFSGVNAIFTSELGVPPEELFSSFAEHPIASASIGQVHKAILKNGDEVAVKVQRPGIKKIIEVDLEIMLHIATLMERNIEEISFHKPVKIVEEFARTLENEIDYIREAANMERFSRQFIDDPDIYIPKVYPETSTSRVLTMEYIDGIKISQRSIFEKNDEDKKIIVERGANLLLKQIFENGFFHADPHPGNIFVLPDNVICFLDYGMVGSIDRTTRENFVDLIDSVVNEDASTAAHVLLQLTNWENEPDIKYLKRDLEDLIGQHLYKTLENIDISRVIQQIFELSYRHHLRIPPDIFFMIKVFGTLESIASSLYPEFDMIIQAKPFIKKIKLSRYNPHRITKDIIRFISDLNFFAYQFPKDILDITRMIKKHTFSIKFEHQGLETMLIKHDQISNRISFSIIIAALLIGSALIVISKTPPLVYGISMIGIVGFIAAAFMGIWLLVAILRKGRL